MSLKVDKVQLEIIMKSDTARAEILKLEDTAKSLEKEMKKLKNDPAELAKKSEEYNKVKSRIAELKKEIGLTGMTMKELQQRSKELSLQLRNIDPRTPKYKEYRDELDKVNARMKELRGNATNTQTGISKLADGFNRYLAIGTAFIASITGISLAFRKLAEDVAHMDDVYSDVMKTTGMTRDEVLSLNEEFKKMDTRTTREDLNKIAEAGGRIGISKEGILDFTKAMDIANVALGDSFTGGVEEISTKLGKLKMLFSETKDMKIEQAYLSIASSINELGANGAASEPNIAEFATRVGSLPEALKPSVAETLALGAAFEESGIEAEVSSRAYNIFLKQASVESGKFAKVMGITTGEVEKLINTNPMDFFLRFSEGMKGMDATEVAQTLDYLGVNADGANKAIGAAANSTERFRELINLSNKSFADGTSVVNEYNIKNDNLAARLDKAKNKFFEVALTVGEKINPILLNSTNAIRWLIKGMVELGEHWRTIVGLLLIITGYTIAYNSKLVIGNLLLKEGLGLKAKDIALKMKNEIVLQALILKEAIYAATVGKTTLASKAAAVAQLLWNKAVMANPYGFVIGALTTIAGIIWLVASRTKELTALQQSHVNIQNNVNSKYEEQAAKIDILNQKIRNENISNAERKKALEQLKAIIPGYNGLLDKEGKLINDNKKAIDDYLVSLEKQIRLKATQEEWENIIREKRKQDKIVAEDKKNLDKANANTNSRGSYSGMPGAGTVSSDVAMSWAAQNRYNKSLEKQNQLKDAQLQLEKELKSYKVYDKDKPAGGGDGGNGVGGTNTPTTTPTSTTKEDPFDKELKVAEEKYKQKLLNQRTWLELGQITEQEFADKGFDLHIAFLEKKLALEEKYGKSTIDTQNAILDVRNNKEKLADDILLKVINDNQTAGILALESANLTKQTMLQESLNNGIISEKAYNSEMKRLAVDLAKAKLAIAQASLINLEKATINDAALKKKQIDDLNTEIARLKSELVRLQGELAKDQVNDDTLDRADQMRSIFGDAFSDIGAMFTNFYQSLDKLKEDDLKNWSDWASAIGGIVQSALAVATQINDQYFQEKAAAIEVDKQRELTDNENRLKRKVIDEDDYNIQKEAINRNYAQKELDLKKKQSSADTNLKVAQALAAGGLAITQAFAQLGPVAGAVAAIALGTITALQVNTIIKQNDAIQATTLESSPSSSSSNQSTGARVVKQAARGRYNVVGEEDRKKYNNVRYAGRATTGLVTAPTLMGEAGTELVIDAPTLRRLNMKVPNFNSFVLSNRVPQRAAGNYDAVQVGQNMAPDNNALMEANLAATNTLIGLVADLQSNGVKAPIVLSELEAKLALRDKSVKKGSLS